MSGRIYRLRRKRKDINFFTFEEYNAVCRNITNANVRPAEPKTLFVQASSAEIRSKVASFVDEILQYNGIIPKKKNQYATKKTAFHFNSKVDAKSALEIVEKMGRPDTILEEQVDLKTGKAVSVNGVKVKVTVTQDMKTGEREAASGGGFLEYLNNMGQTNKSSSTSSASSESSKNSSMTKWLIVGGVVLVILVVLLAILRKKKII